jgi:transcriptional regulator with XRE-family HTH domain
MAPVRTVWGQRIAEARRAIPMTQVQLAAAVRVTQQVVSSWEHGRAAPNINRRPHIARILGIPTDVLFAYPDTNGDEEAA